MAVLLGGRAAETLVFGHLSTGAADDLAKVTDIARSMVMRYGMVEKLGNVAYEQDRPLFLGGPRVEAARDYSEETAREIDCAVREIVKHAFDKALAILTARRAVLEKSAAALLQKETLGEEELAQIRAQLAPSAS
jgi:cell division protease FtsH